MAKTLRQRQADWRSRRDLKSAMFDVLNEQRVNALEFKIIDDGRPETRAIAAFFLAYPRCWNWYHALDLDDGTWRFSSNPTGSVYEDAAVFVALSEVTSLPIVYEHGAFDEAAIATVQQEVAELRRLNLWGVQQ